MGGKIMRNLLAMVVIMGLVGLVIGCGGKYADVIEVNQAYVQLLSDYIEAVDKVENAADAAAAINGLADGMEELTPKMKAMSEKYPNLQDAEDLPEALQKTNEEMNRVSEDFGSTFMKLMPYMSDAKVQKAQNRLSNVMCTMGRQMMQ